MDRYPAGPIRGSWRSTRDDHNQVLMNGDTAAQDKQTAEIKEKHAEYFGL
jgi:hypothetical protein